MNIDIDRFSGEPKESEIIVPCAKFKCREMIRDGQRCYKVGQDLYCEIHGGRIEGAELIFAEWREP
jgi:hypothetical protein